MKEIYSRNRLYITPEEQSLIANCKLLLGGSGLGSIIAECALRLGFENICIIDGDTIELSNLNRQNYIYENIGNNKSEVLCDRLKAINPNANITCEVDFLDADNIGRYLTGVSVAINALDFASDVPFLFDECCVEQGIAVLHPYNLGWAGLVTIVDGKKSLLSQIGNWSNFELKMGEYIIHSLSKRSEPVGWLQNVVEEVEKERGGMPLPQLPIASWITAGLCTSILFKIATGKTYKSFPEYYYLSSF